VAIAQEEHKSVDSHANYGVPCGVDLKYVQTPRSKLYLSCGFELF